VASEQDIGRLVVELLLKDDRYKAALKSNAKATKSFGSDLERTAGELRNIFGTALNVVSKGALMFAGAMAAAGAAMVGLGVAALKTGGDFEAYEARLTTLLGSASLAKERMDDLFRIASTTPFNLNQVVEADVTLEAFGANVEGAREGVMNLAGAMGIDLVEAATGLGRAFAGGAGAADVLRERGVLAAVELRAGMKTAEMTTEQFRETLLQVLNEDFAGGAARLAATYQGAISNIEDSWTRFTKDIADAGLFDGVKGGLRGVLDLMEQNKDATKELADEIGKGLLQGLMLLVRATGRFVDVSITVALVWSKIREQILLTQIGFKDFLKGFIPFSDALQAVADDLPPAVQGFVKGLVPGSEMLLDNTTELRDRFEETRENTKALEAALGSGSEEADRLAKMMKVATQQSALTEESTEKGADNTGDMADNTEDVADAAKEANEEFHDLLDVSSGIAGKLLTTEGLAADLSEAMGLNVSLGERLRDAVGTLPAAMSRAMQGVRSFASGFKGVLGTVTSVIGSLTGGGFSLGDLIGAAGGETPRQDITAMVDSARAFAMGLAQNMGAVASAFVNAIPGLVGPIGKAAEGLLKAIGRNLPRLLGRIIQQTLSLSKQLVPIIFDVLGTVLGALPRLLRRVLGDTAVILDLLTDALPGFIDALAAAIPPILMAIIETFPAIAGALTRLLTVLAVELTKAIVIHLIPAIPSIVIALVKALVDSMKEIGEAFAGAIIDSITRWRDGGRERGDTPRFGDTPGAIRAGQRGLVAGFAPSDYVVAAQTPGDVLRQALELSSRSGQQAPGGPPGAPSGPPSQPTRVGVTVMAEGQVLDQALVTAGQRGRAPSVQRAFSAGAGVQLGFDQGGFVLQTP